MDNNQKIDNELNLALNISKKELSKTPGLSAGYDPEKDTWEVIVKYNGDIKAIGDKYGALTEILTDQYAIITIGADRMNELAVETQVEYIEKPKNMKVQLDDALYDACIENVQNFPQYNLKGKGVIIGVIDSGIDFTHPDFINEDGTSRILYLWDQTIDGKPPEGFVFGTEYTNKEINDAIKLQTKDEVFKALPSQDIVGHGTAVAGVAGGNGRGSDGKYIGAAPEAEFIIVKMGQKGFESFAKNTEIMRGLKYIIEMSEKEQKPVSINISYGNNNGSHDGSSIFETYIDAWSSYWKNTISVGSGNEGISGKHTSGYLGQGDTKDVEVFIQANESNISLQIWKAYEDDIEVELVAPSGQSTGFIKQLLGTQRFRLDFTDVLLYYGEPSPFSPAQQIYIELVPVENVLNNGKWTIRLKANKVVTGKYDIWLPISFETSRETMFAQPTTDTTLTIPSTALSIICVGAYNSKINSIAPFSGRGYTRTDNMVKPDLVAPGVGIMAPKAGGGYSSFSGTSIATPFVTGSSALLMEYGIVLGNDPFLYGQKVKAYLISGAKRDKPNLNYPNNIWGYGTLCLQNSVDVINRSMPYYRDAVSGTVTTNAQAADIKRIGTAERTEIGTRQEEDNGKKPDVVSETLDETLDEENIIPKVMIEKNCAMSAISNDYIDIIRKYYIESIDEDAKEYKAPCYELLSSVYATFFIPIGENTCDEMYKAVAFTELPNIYGLANLKNVEEAGILPVISDNVGGLQGDDILIGVVDTGIDYTHPCFLDKDGKTRISYIWDQTGDGEPPKGFLFGTEYNRYQINEALESEDPYSIVKQRDTVGHGTFITGVAAGSKDMEERFTGAAPQADIAVVKLKQAKKCLMNYYLISNPDVPSYQTNDIILGMRYLLKKALELKKALVLLFAGQTTMTAHNGTSILEDYIDSFVEYDNLVYVTVAGNEANTAHHFRGYLTEQEKEVEMELEIHEGEPGFFIYMWNAATDKLSVSITSPGGIETGRIPVKVGLKQELILTEKQIEVLVEYHIDENEQATYIRLKNPTYGVWSIKVYGEEFENGVFDAYLPSSNFLPKSTRFLKPDPLVTVTDPGNANTIITTGGYNGQSNGIYFPSGRGYSRANVVKPDFNAPGVNITGPVVGGGYGLKSGTSVAAALAAGASAIVVEWGKKNNENKLLTTTGVKNALIRGCSRKETVKYPNRQWGYGELNLANTIDTLEEEKKTP